MAYITQAIATEKADKACERYREHRSVMSLLPDSRWQAEVADLMLSRVEAISVARMQAYRKRPTVPEVVAHFQKVLFEARFSKIFWVAAGMILFARLLNYEVGGF